MKIARLHRLLILSIVGGLLVLALAAPVTSEVSAQEAFPRRSFLEIYPIEVVTAGQKPVVHVRLTSEDAKALPNKPVILSLDGEDIRQIRTDENGEAAIYISRDLPAGVYEVKVEFIGTDAYLATSSSRTLTVRPALLTIETVPPQLGIIFSLDGKRYPTQEDGIARIEINQSGMYTLETIIPQSHASGQDFQVKFDRWIDETFDPVRQVEISGDKYLQAGFVLFYPVGQTFVDLNGDPVDKGRVSSLTLKSSFGAKYTFEDGNYRLLQANRIARRKTGLEATPVQYSVESVMIDGANVVNQSQQRFFVAPKDIWQIELLLYYARVQTKDALLGFSIGDGVSLEFPDGRTVYYEFGEDRELTLGPLARGFYKLRVTGVGGMAPLTPIALSQNQEVELVVLSAWDIGMGIAFGMLIVLGLLFWGRPQLLNIPKRLASAIRLPARRPLKNESS
ncbi:MAG: Ig-like domain repeat protein [Anaerolineales bacterium]|nr:Ig-like domain repeat protein [Anaerolineales bacterium]